MIKNFQSFKFYLFAIAAIELFSFFCYYIRELNLLFFWLLLASTVVLSWKKLEYGVFIVLGELFIGSKGYLYFIELGNLKLSLRIALWSILMLVWFVKFILPILKEKSLKNLYPDINNKRLTTSFAALFFFILIGIVIGYYNQPSLKTVFLDANAWIYFALIFPLYQILRTDEVVEKLWSLFWAANTWIAIKTLLLLFVFSHQQELLIFALYNWVRNTGIGEITLIQEGFYRIFIQSQIFNLLGFFISLAWIIKLGAEKKISELPRQKSIIFFFSLLLLNIIVILLSFSRSFWVGGLAGTASFIVWLIFAAKKYNGYISKNLYFWKSIRLSIISVISCLALSVFILTTVILFPWPRPTGGFNAADVFSSRLTQTDESAIGSRWALLPKLWDKIKINPLVGQGFGAEVTYQSKDPRVIAQNPSGEYTTSAFEWGWLDIWLKIGMLGMFSYLYLLYKIARAEQMSSESNSTGLPSNIIFLCLFILSTVHIFTPYLNHPLGIGFVVVAAALAIRK